MHQPTLTPNHSSYFQYQIYPFQRPPEMDGETAPHPVTVVGAGPVGLLTAVHLALNGVRCVLIEAEAQVSGGSRALAFTKRSMEIFEQAGVAEAILEQADTWQDGRSYYKNRAVHHLHIPANDDDKFAPMTNLPQCMIEQILVDRALQLGVDIRFQTRLAATRQDADGVTLTLDTPEGEYSLRTEWLVGCDGARSSVRKLENLRFTGKSFETRFVIADFKIDLDEPVGRRCYFEPPWLPDGAALLHKAPLGVWRLDYQVPPDLSDEEAIDRDRIKAEIDSHLAYIGSEQPWEFEWVTLYKPNALTLDHYRHGRVLLCGDAAHLLPVFGVRGLNTGAQDAINLGWKLAAVVQGRAPASLLDTYSTERVADARQICVEATRSTRMMAPPSRGYRIMQQAVLSLSLKHEFPRDLLHWRTSHPIDYETSALTLTDVTEPEFNGGPVPGAPARNARLDPQNESAGFLLDAFEPAFQVFVFGNDDALWTQAAADVAALRQRGIATRLIGIGATPPASIQPDASFPDPAAHIRQAWGVSGPAIYVLRPDQHVAARWRAGSPLTVHTVVEHVLAAGAAA